MMERRGEKRERMDLVEGVQKMMKLGEERMDPEEKKRKKVERYTRRDELRRKSKQRSRKRTGRGEA
jgi:hypothetical protein